MPYKDNAVCSCKQQTHFKVVTDATGERERGKEEERGGGGENGPPERRNYYSGAQIILHQNLEKL